MCLVLYLVRPQGRLWLVVNKYRGDFCVLLSIEPERTAGCRLREINTVNGGHYCVIDVGVQLQL